MRRRGVVVALAAALLGAAAMVGLAYLLLRPHAPRPPRATLTVADVWRGDSAGFARALAPRTFSFPRDHGPHPGYRTEWWYFTGNLDTAQGRHFGYELTIFRVALSPSPIARASQWAADAVYMAHFAVSDVAARSFRAFERFARGALGLAGAQASPFRVWVEDWSIEGSGPDALPMRLRAAEDGFGIDLALNSAKAPVLQGERGLSQKSAQPGNASYYYSMTRMPTTGSLRLGEETFRVSGLSWMDREWGSSALAADQVGWDWFALQLSDGRDLMFYRLRRRDGSTDPWSAGSVVDQDETVHRLSRADVRIEVLDRWRSPSGVRYPARWRLSVPEEGLDLEITPISPTRS